MQSSHKYPPLKIPFMPPQEAQDWTTFLGAVLLPITPKIAITLKILFLPLLKE
jgi:hypothetical protein